MTALVAAGAFSVHQLRYLLAHGDAAGQVLANEGHSYLTALAPLLAVLVGVALLDFLLTLLARRDDTATPAGRARWGAVTVTLLAVYVCQESLEGLLSPGHPGGLDALIGNGGWVAAPLALAVGLVIALVLRTADRVIASLARHRPRPLVHVRRAARRSRPAAAAARRSPLASKLAGRAPPAASCT